MQNYVSIVRSIEEDVTIHSDLTFCVSENDHKYFKKINKNAHNFIFVMVQKL